MVHLEQIYVSNNLNPLNLLLTFDITNVEKQNTEERRRWSKILLNINNKINEKTEAGT